MLQKIAGLMELHGENPHRIRALNNAARSVERLEGDLAEMVASGDILEVRGIGKGTSAILTDLAAGREPDALVDLDRRTPPGVKEMLEISGLGPKKTRTLWKELGVTSVGELEYACRENRLVELSGFGPASQARFLEAVRFHRFTRDRHLVHQAFSAAEELMDQLQTSTDIEDVRLAGELRRGFETVGSIDLVAVGREENAGDLIRSVLDDAERPGSGMWTGRFGDGFRVRVRLVADHEASAALLWATGDESHLLALQRRAEEVGLVLDRRGVWSEGQLLSCREESELYAALGSQWVPPELRNGKDEVNAAMRGSLPELVKVEDLLGALHNHTTDSDGNASVEEMARAAGRLGWGFLGIGDHSPAAHYANGLTGDRLRAQWAAIDELNRGGGLPRLVKGIEADILSDGRLDVPDGCGDGLEYVVASVHSSFRLSESAQTDRMIAAVRHPACRILGHPTGRLLLARPGYEVDLDKVLETCADSGVAVEINASPYRLDLNSEWARRAVELDIPLAINPDAHSIEGLEDVRWGVMVARRAGATAADVVNCGDINGWVGTGDERRKT